MKTALIFAVATLGFAASVAWAADVPARADLAPQPARLRAPADARPAARPLRVPAAPAAHTQPVDQRTPTTPGSTAPDTLCACTGGDHFA